MTGVRANNVFNDFIMLANTQFVENVSIPIQISLQLPSVKVLNYIYIFFYIIDVWISRLCWQIEYIVSLQYGKLSVYLFSYVSANFLLDRESMMKMSAKKTQPRVKKEVKRRRRQGSSERRSSSPKWRKLWSWESMSLTKPSSSWTLT